MSLTELDFQKTVVQSTPQTSSRGSTSLITIPVADLTRYAEDWFLDCEYRMHSPKTIETRRVFVKSLLWFLNNRGCQSCGTPELRQFFSYLLHGHEESGGRWGNPRLTQPVRPITVKDYWVNIRCLFNWLVTDGVMESSPMDKIPKPRVAVEKVQPFSEEQIEALLQATRKIKTVSYTHLTLPTKRIV